MTYYQALLLLGIPEDEREKFILQHDVEDMTTRELDQALKERNQTAPEKEQAQVTPMPNNPQDIKLDYLTVKVYLGFFARLDGVRVIEDTSFKGMLELYYTNDSSKLLLNNEQDDYLHDIYKDLTSKVSE